MFDDNADVKALRFLSRLIIANIEMCAPNGVEIDSSSLSLHCITGPRWKTNVEVLKSKDVAACMDNIKTMFTAGIDDLIRWIGVEPVMFEMLENNGMTVSVTCKDM